MKKPVKKLVTSLLTAALVVTLLPSALYADPDGNAETAVEEQITISADEPVDGDEIIDIPETDPEITDYPPTQDVAEEPAGPEAPDPLEGGNLPDHVVDVEEETETEIPVSDGNIQDEADETTVVYEGELGEGFFLVPPVGEEDKAAAEPEEDATDPVPPAGGHEDPGYRLGTSEYEGEGEAPLSEEVLNTASSAPAAFSLVNVGALNDYFVQHNFQWFGRDCVSSVRDQGSYGLCWAFAGLGACESSLLLYNQETAPTSLDLSELQAAYYTQIRNSSSQPVGCEGDTSSLISTTFGQAGGNQEELINSVTRRIGFVNESAAPYSQLSTGLSSSLTNGTLAKTSFRYYIQNVEVVLGSDKEKIKTLIMKNGGAACSVYFSTSDYFNKSTSAMYCGDSSISTSHDVVVVGWDDNYPRTNFKTYPSSNGAWLVKNSWGTSSNKDGYFWVSYQDKPFCNDNVYSFQCVAPSNSPSKIYQHDGGLFSGHESYQNKAYMANVFRSTANESLAQVSFFTKEDELDYQVQIYTDVAGTPINGVLASSATTSGHCTYAGFHTITLRNPVDLVKNDRFSVVIRLSDTRGRHVSMTYEKSKTTSIKTSTVRSETGESFYSSNGTSWVDRSTKDSGNYRIKAYTNSKPLVTRRLAGADRYSTMALIAQQAFPDGASEVIMVTGSKFPDALAAAPLAGAKKCPLLITRLDKLSDPVKTLLASSWNKKVKKVTLIGKGFSSSVTSTLRNTCGVTSIDSTTFAGADRYDTACRICEYGLNNGYFSTSTVVVATGAKAADALSMSPWAYYYKMPILLVNSKGQITTKTKNLMRKFDKGIAVGGNNVVPERVLYGNVGEIIRLFGSTRYETSVRIAEFFVPSSDGSDGSPAHSSHFVDQIVFAPGADKNFPDALVGAMLAGGTNCYSKPAPIILVSANGVDPLATSFISRYRPSSYDPLCAYFLGAVTTSVENTIKNQLTSLM